MIAPLAKLMDWSAVQLATLMMPADASMPKLEEAIQFLKGPDFIPSESQPAQLEFNGPFDFRFPTPRPCDFAVNNIVHGRLYRGPGQWQERPVIILLHGMADSFSYKLRFPLIARRFNRAGINAAMLVAPYHFQRCPPQRGEIDFGNCLRFAEGTAQGIAEIRALAGWLLGQGCPAVALWGFSMGARYAGMVVCHDARLAAAVLAGPPAPNRPSMEQMAIRPGIRANLPRFREICDGLNLTPMNLATTRPVIPKENILLIEASHDLMICPKDDTEDLCHAWGQPDIWRLPHGHVGVCCGGVPGLTGRVLRWLEPRLNAPAVAH